MKLPRLDILLYAHDGRGLGHVSRSIGIGMAIRRLYPELSVLLVSGCAQSQELIAEAPLDWLKLPAYKSVVSKGKSRGLTGNSGFSDNALGGLRSRQLQQLVSLYRPRLALVDHTPQGKHRELVAALQPTPGESTRWILGVRGVIGAVPQARSELAGDLFRSYYHGLLWYGDSRVLGDEHLNQLRQLYGMQPVECGYVSRMAELMCWQGGGEQSEHGFAGTIAVPWLGERSLGFLRTLAGALQMLDSDSGPWRLFLDYGEAPEVREEIRRLFDSLPHCQLTPPSGPEYVEALRRSRSALIYGGYNSLLDVLTLRLPATVVLREMKDNEQQLHVQLLQRYSKGLLNSVAESEVSSAELCGLLRKSRDSAGLDDPGIATDGARNAATYLRRLL